MKPHLFLKPEEAKFLGMAVVAKLEDLQRTSNNTAIPWNPESRKTLKEMIEAGKMLKTKLEKLGFDVRPLPDVANGELDDYLTKES